MIANRHNPFARILHAEASPEGGDTGGGGTPTAPEQSTPATPPSPEAKPPNVIELAVAGLKSKAVLNQEITTLRETLSKAEHERDTIQAENLRLTTELTRYKDGETQLREALTKAEGENQTTQAAAATQLAGMGIAPTALPGQTSEMPETVEQLEGQLAKATDGKERFRIQKKINALQN